MFLSYTRKNTDLQKKTKKLNMSSAIEKKTHKPLKTLLVRKKTIPRCRKAYMLYVFICVLISVYMFYLCYANAVMCVLYVLNLCAVI